MKIHVVYAHPYFKSYNAAIKDRIVSSLQEAGHDVSVSDLYEMNFNPVLAGPELVGFRTGTFPDDSKAEMDKLREADRWIFIYPIWWTGLPGILKGYIDRVFAYGFAYAYGPNGIDQLLTGKQVMIVNTTGTPTDMYDASGMTGSLKQTMGTGIFEFSGVEVVDHLFFGGVGGVTPEQREAWLEESVTRALAFASR